MIQLAWVDIKKIVMYIHDSGAVSIPGILKWSLRKLCGYGKSLPCVGGYLASVEGMLRNEVSKDVARMVENLSEQIGAMRLELFQEISCEAVKLQYCDSVTKIETGFGYLSQILMPTNDDERKRFEKRLIELCSNQTMTEAVRKLLKGFTGESLLHNDILETMYRASGGHRDINERMRNQFLQLVNGGLAVIAAYETLVRGREAALEMQTLFEDDTEIMKTRFEEFRRRDLREHMLEDLNRALDSNISNKDAVADLSRLLLERYEWLEGFCIVCNESNFIDYDFTGDHVKSLERNGRFGVIFYRKKPKGPTSRKLQTKILLEVDWSNQFSIVLKETDTYWFPNAAEINSVLNASFSRIGLSLWGCATVKAKRIISIPLINLLQYFTSYKSFHSFETSRETDETSEAVADHKKCRMHVYLISKN